MGGLVGPDFPGEIGLAVSGGGDSMAMLHLAAGWARAWGVGLRVVTVDHGLRPESASEAAMVASEAQALGLSHETLTWDQHPGTGNLMDAARQARLRLIGAWCGPVRHVAFAHTRDDVAETFLMRLRRGSGVEGLSEIAGRRTVDGFEVIRPLREISRVELRQHNDVLGIPYVDDPTNSDPAFERSRMRQLLQGLEAQGLGVECLAATARRLRRSREALERRALDAATAAMRPAPEGDVALDRDAFARIEADTQLRILAGALQFVASAPYRPRVVALEETLDRVLAGGDSTLHGCRILARKSQIYLFREHAAVAGLAMTDGRWDRRWLVSDRLSKGLAVAALGDAGMDQAGRPETPGAPRAALRSAPALWDGPRLVACPRIGLGDSAPIRLDPPGGSFPECLLSD